MKKRILSAMIAAALLATGLGPALAAPHTWAAAASGAQMSLGTLAQGDEGGSPNALYAADPDKNEWISFLPDAPGESAYYAPINNPHNSVQMFAAEYVDYAAVEGKVGVPPYNDNNGAGTAVYAKVFRAQPGTKNQTSNGTLYRSDMSNISVNALDAGGISVQTASVLRIEDLAFDYTTGTLFMLRRTSVDNNNQNNEVRLFHTKDYGAKMAVTPTGNNNGGVFTTHTGLTTVAADQKLTASGDILALAIDLDGTGYIIFRAFNGKAYLYSVDLPDTIPTAAGTPIVCTLIGDTGFTTDNVHQAMTFDHATGRLYWAQYTAKDGEVGGGHLVELDKATGAGRNLGETSGNITGLFCAPKPQPIVFTFEVNDQAGGSLTAGSFPDGSSVPAGNTFSVTLDRGLKTIPQDYFANAPALEVQSGYEFVGWTTPDGTTVPSLNALDGYALLCDTTFTANFAVQNDVLDIAAGAPASKLNLVTYGQYSWAAIEVNGVKMIKSTNGAFDAAPVFKVGGMAGQAFPLENVIAQLPSQLTSLYPSVNLKHNNRSTVAAVVYLMQGDVIRYDYRMNAHITNDLLYFKLNGEIKASHKTISPMSEAANLWESSTPIEITEEGAYLLEWTFVKKGGYSMYSDAAYLKNIYAGASDAVALTAMSIPNAEIIVGNYLELPVTKVPADASARTFTWTSSNPTVASVSADGRVKGVSPGTATITVSYRDERVNDATCEITVIEGARPVRLYAYDLSPDVNAWVAFNSDNPTDYTTLADPNTSQKRVMAAEYVGDVDGSGDVYGYFLDTREFFKTTLAQLGESYTVLGTLNEGLYGVYDMAYDQSTGIMYALSHTQDAEMFASLNTVDLTTGELTYLYMLREETIRPDDVFYRNIDMSAITFTPQGILYGVSDSGGAKSSYLYRIDRDRGIVTQVVPGTAAGLTGALSGGHQGLTYDAVTGRFFWAQNYPGGPWAPQPLSSLYELDPVTGKATELGYLNYNRAAYTGLIPVRGVDIAGYYADKGITPVNYDCFIPSDVPVSEVLSFLPKSGYVKYSDGSLEAVAYSWAWETEAPANTAHDIPHGVVGAVTGGTFAHGETIVGSITFVPRAAAPVITEQPANQVVVQSKAAAALRVTAESPDGGSLSYQWYMSSGTTGSTAIPGATQATYTPGSTTVGTLYYSVSVTNTSNNNGTTLFSDVVTVQVIPASAAIPSITAQPSNITVAWGGTAALSVAAQSPDGGALSYQWYFSSDGSLNGTEISGATGSSFSPGTFLAGTRYFYVKVTNTFHGFVASAISAVAAVVVNPAPMESGPAGGAAAPSTAITVTTEDHKIVATYTAKPNTSTAGGVVTSTATVPGTVITEALALAAAKQDSAADAVAVQIKVDVSSGAQAAALALPQSAFAAIAGKANAGLMVDLAFANISLDAKAVAAIAKQAGSGSIRVQVSQVNRETLTQEAQAIVGNRPVVDIQVLADGAQITHLEGGTAMVSLPYTPTAQERANPDAIVVYALDSSGALQNVAGKYNAKTGAVEFEAVYFSRYAVGFDLVTYPDTPAWAKAAATFAAARGIINYDGMFEPDKTVTRGEFLVALMKTYAIDVSNPKDSYAFADVAKDAALYPYAVVARELGMTDGSDAARNLFDPDAVVDRQQIAAFFIKALEAMSKLPETNTGRTLADYIDGDTVAPWAVPYVEKAIKAGLINSTSAETWVADPALLVSRAQMVQLIYNLF